MSPPLPPRQEVAGGGNSPNDGVVVDGYGSLLNDNDDDIVVDDQTQNNIAPALQLRLAADNVLGIASNGSPTVLVSSNNDAANVQDAANDLNNGDGNDKATAHHNTTPRVV